MHDCVGVVVEATVHATHDVTELQVSLADGTVVEIALFSAKNALCMAMKKNEALDAARAELEYARKACRAVLTDLACLGDVRVQISKKSRLMLGRVVTGGASHRG